jgi:hypothetical protein
MKLIAVLLKTRNGFVFITEFALVESIERQLINPRSDVPTICGAGLFRCSIFFIEAVFS